MKEESGGVKEESSGGDTELVTTDESSVPVNE